MPSTRVWIPPASLLAAQLAHGASWVLLLALAAGGDFGGLRGLAWVHLVALGFLTLAALGVLVHVLQGFIDLEWTGEGLARWSLLPFGLGAWGLAGAFWAQAPGWLPVAGALLAAGLAGYLVPAGLSLWRCRPAERADRAVRRAFAVVLAFLAATAAAGLAMAGALAAGGPTWLLQGVPAVHAHLGGVGWLTLLVLGVSVRTVRPITGARSRHVGLHVAASALLLFGLVGLAAGLLGGAPIAAGLGAGLAAIGAAVYVADLAAVLAAATVPHRPPQAFLAASGLAFLGAAALGLGVLLGHAAWRPAYAFLALAGWLGQMVNGHLHHIGVRVLATVARGDDDETRPEALLAAPLSWTAFAVSQLAVVTVTAGLLAGRPAIVMAGAFAGLAGWVAMGANVAIAWRRAVAP